MTPPAPGPGPSASVDVFAPPEAPVGRGWGALSLIPLAAFVFAVVAWGFTALMAYESERRGIAGATVAMFPTGFGAGGLVVRRQQLRALERSGRKPGAAVLLLVSLFCGIFAMAIFALFMVGIWPEL